MATQQIGRIVTVSLVGGMVAATALVVGPVAGAQEHVITGIVLLTFAASWALLAILSTLWTAQPQRWAAALAGFMAFAGAGLLIFAGRRRDRRARLDLAAALPRASGWRRDPRSPEFA